MQRLRELKSERTRVHIYDSSRKRHSSLVANIKRQRCWSRGVRVPAPPPPPSRKIPAANQDSIKSILLLLMLLRTGRKKKKSNLTSLQCFVTTEHLLKRGGKNPNQTGRTTLWIACCTTLWHDWGSVFTAFQTER